MEWSPQCEPAMGLVVYAARNIGLDLAQIGLLSYTIEIRCQFCFKHCNSVRT